MNILDGTYTNEEGLVTKTKRVVKMAIKTTAYTAFLGIAVASALHLYNNPEDRTSVKNGLKSIGAGIEAKVNDSVFKLTGHNLTSQVAKVGNLAEKGFDSTVSKAKEITPTQEEGKQMVQKVKNAGQILNDGVKKEAPGIGDTVKQDAQGSVEKAKEEVKHKIKQVRQYTGDLTQRLASEIKPK